jgi:hypothetical protein
MLKYVHKLPRLRTFIWSAQPQEGHENQLSMIPRETQENLTSCWSQTMPSFEVAYFVAEHGKNLYWRWSRGELGPTEVSSLDFRHLTPFHKMVMDDRLSH